ncbi:MAG: protein translocase subunit SecF [Betaproteobacteria bacterium]|nr:protein translocase subunit SecF [Betaproteobacteria bacterium]
MEFFKIKKSIPFMRHSLAFNVISFVTFLLAVFFLATKGLHLSIEFTGGTVMEVTYPQAADPEKVRGTLNAAGLTDVTVQKFGSSRDLLIRLPLKLEKTEKGGDNQNEAMQKQKESVFAALTAQPAPGEASECAAVHAEYAALGKIAFKERDEARVAAMEEKRVALGEKCTKLVRTEFVGSQVGSELATDGAMALLAVCLGIMAYLAIRFKWRFAVATIIANLHDVVIILGFFAFFQWEFSLPVLAGILAILGYSVNESVVVFDRAREMFRKMRKATTEEVFDAAITGTISRTIITHGSTQMAVVAMLIWGGPTLHYFALALTIGICFGIYSSVLVACPLAKYLGATRADFVEDKKAEAGKPVTP